MKDPNSFTALLQAVAQPPATTTITLQELEAAQQAAAKVDVSAVVPLLAQLRAELLKQGIQASDRRWRQSVSVIQAHAWLNGHAVADASDATILQHVLWDDPEQRLTVAKAVLMLVSPYDQEAQDVLDDARDAYLKAMGAPEDDQTTVGLEVNKTLTAAAKQLAKVWEKSDAAGKPSTVAREGLAQLTAWGEEVLKQCLKV